MKLQIDKFTEDVFESEGATDTASSDNEPPEDIITGRTAEVREHENRPNLKGERVTKVIETKEDVEDEEILKYAMRSYKTFDHGGVLLSNYVEIPSPYIKEALRVVVKEYPSQSFQGDTIIIHGKLRCLFHYREELAAYVDALEDGTASLHIKLALRFMEKELRKSIKSYTAHVETATAKPSIEFENLWMVFKPGELIVTGRGEKLRVLQLVSTYLTSGCDPNWYIYGRFVTHDGTSFGYAEEKLTISEFEGSKEIRQLSVFPLEFHEDRDSIRESLLTRGHKFCSLSGIYHRSYDGIASALGQERDQNQWGQVDKFPLETRTVKGRIIVDSKTFGIVKSPNRVILQTRKPSTPDSEDGSQSLTTQDLIICDYRVPGYSLYDKRWCWFSVDLIKDVEYNSEAFKDLLLPASQKSLVHALVKNHGSSDDVLDDMIKGKGKGLVFVLHGAPGVGKTFTAESIADHIRRPLYVLNAGELGVTPEDVETHLNNALMLATAWNAIILIDEADVFLEQRTVQDLTRNCLVSLFLRVLEYYEGILFLTTNRITTFDLAFKSRIHLALKYQALNASARKELWRLFIGKIPKADNEVHSEKSLDNLAAVDLNGRQIKNAVRTAHTLARSSGQALNQGHLDIVLETLKEFEKDLNDQTQDISFTNPGLLKRQSTLSNHDHVRE